MHCPHCRQQILPETRFCPNCGMPISQVTYPSPPQGTVRPVILRPRTGRMIGGVCAAFARAYGWNVTLVRVLLVVLTPLHLGLGFLAYLILWIIIPEEPYALPANTPPTPPTPL